MGDEASQLAQLAQCLSASLSPDAATRQNAEQFLASGAQQGGFSILLLKLVASDAADAPARVAGAVAFKNLVKKHWNPAEEPDVVGAPAPYRVGDAEKDQVRNLLVGLMLGAPKLARAQLGEALSIVSAADFPDRWPGLLPELITRLGAPGAQRNWATVAGVLTTANTIFKKYRQAYKSDELYKELKYALDGFARPVLALTTEAATALAAATSANDTAACVTLLTVLRLACRIFFSLNSQELPEVFEDDMDAWMGAFHGLLAYENASLDGPEGSPADAVKAAICDNVNLYIEKNEEEFQRFLQTFVQDVWTLLTKTGLESGKDRLVTSGVRFLTAVANSVHSSLFGGGDVLRQVCESIVIPNLTFTEDDEELFESNHVEYVRRDIEGSDSDTRRRGACELVRALTLKFPEVMTSSVSGYVGALLAQHASDPAANWKAKDAAVTLVVALLVKAKTNARGATELNELGLSVVDFFNTQIAPEFARAATDGGASGNDVGTAVTRADALKFVTVFRGFLPKAIVAPHLPAIVACLRARENVTHTYAANCLDKLLAVRESEPNANAPNAKRIVGKTPRYDASDLAPVADALFSNLFGVFDMPDSRENEYAMRAVVRVIDVLGERVKPLASACVQKLAAFLAETCANPKNPTFSHFLFEGVSGLLRHAATDTQSMAAFEQALFPPFQFVLQQDVVEFAPYVFQLLAQMIEARNCDNGDALPASYLGIFPALLAPSLWDRQANVTPLVRLLEAYLRKAPREIVSGAASGPGAANHLTGVLGVFQKLAASRAQDHQGFFILNALAECLPLDAWRAHLPAVWGVLFQRLQTSKTAKFTKCLVVFTCLLCAKHGPGCVEETTAAVQPGIFEMLVKSVVAPAAPSVSGAVETKVVAVAAANVLSASAGIKGDLPAWCALLSAAVATLEKPQEAKDAEAAARGEGGDANAEAEAAENERGYAAAYNPLRNAARRESDPRADVADPKTHLAQKLAAVSAETPGVFGAAIAQHCPPEVQRALAAYCAAAGVAVR